MKRNGFTLIELLIAIGIITILMTIVIVGTGFLRNKARVDATTMLIRKINVGLNEYNLAFDAYPPSEGDYEGSQNLYNFLGKSFEIEQGYDPATGKMMKKRFGPALSGGFSKSELKDQYIIDAWGKAMTYKNPGEDHSSSNGANNESFVDIESAGSNGVFDDDDSAGDDDISNWKQEKYLSK
ncbi:MAG TPA: prepilin-type N-terminal cleavage/methylation domain-containing protein [Planctomycetota bacterium]|nr:prepilin-type N-terminal cleavage/methylation domain-containing protein [Planctomycetota bacterium]